MKTLSNTSSRALISDFTYELDTGLPKAANDPPGWLEYMDGWGFVECPSTWDVFFKLGRYLAGYDIAILKAQTIRQPRCVQVFELHPGKVVFAKNA